MGIGLSLYTFLGHLSHVFRARLAKKTKVTVRSPRSFIYPRHPKTHLQIGSWPKRIVGYPADAAALPQKGNRILGHPTGPEEEVRTFKIDPQVPTAKWKITMAFIGINEPWINDNKWSFSLIFTCSLCDELPEGTCPHITTLSFWSWFRVQYCSIRIHDYSMYLRATVMWVSPRLLWTPHLQKFISDKYI